MKKIYSTSFFMKAALVHYFLTLAISVVASAAPANGQGILDKKISLSVENEAFRTVLEKISRKAGVKFSYTRNTIPEKEKVSLKAQDETLARVFTQLFQPYDIQFEAIGSQVVLKRSRLFALLQNERNMAVTLDNVRFKKVTGVVKDPMGTPLPGVTVVVKGTRKGASTDGEGRFELDAEDGNVLELSAIGYKTISLHVTAETSYAVVMEVDEKALGEVVVTALGVKRSPRSLGYAVQKVTGDDINIAQAPTIAQGLMGKVAGLNISNASGGVEGGSSRLVIRGNTSLTGDNRALIIVDGVALNNDPVNNNDNNGGGGAVGTQQGADVSGYNDWGTGLNFINPEDIEDVTVLKGPAAAALYGARGANGVILVTRKKGEKRKGLGVDYTFSHRKTQVYEFLDFQNSYGSGLVGSMWTADQQKQFPIINGRRAQIGTYSGSFASGDYKSGAWGFLPYTNTTQAWNVFSFPSGLSWGPRFDNQPVLWYDGVQRPYSAQPDNWKDYFPDGYVNQHNVAVSGGGDFGTIRFSYTRDDSKANILNSNFKNNTFNLGSSIKISKILSADITASYINYTRLNTPPVGAGAFMAGFSYAATRDFRSDVERMNNFNADGSQRDVTVKSNFPGDNPNYPYYSYMTNSYWSIYKNNTTFNRNQLIGGLKLTANITDWLTATAQGSLDNSSDGTEIREYPRNIQGTTGAYKEAMSRNLSRNLNAMLRVYKDNLWGRSFNASLTGGVESYYRNDYTTSARTKGNFISPFIFAIKNSSEAPDPAQELRFQKKINSGFGFLDLSYKNYLFLQVTGRNDWSSTLSDGNNSYFYPSANVSYVFTDGITGMQSAVPWLSFGKLSLSYAETGSDTDPYSIFNVLNTVNVNGQAAQTYPAQLKFAGVEPQRSRQYEIGLSLGMFNNRLNVDVTAYTMKTFNQILTNPLPQSSGWTSVQLNKGSLGNKGIEFIINATPVSSKNFSWSVSLNGSHAQNKILALDEGIEELTLGSFFGGSGVSQRVKVGENYGTLYGRDYTYLNGQKVVKRAVNPETGEELYYEVNGQRVPAGTQWVLSDTEVPIGNSQPFLTGGIANTFRYKDFSLYVLADGKFGGDTYFGTYAAAMGNGLLNETLKERDGGGVPYIYPDGTTANTGVIFDGVFADGKQNTDVVSYHWKYLGTYTSWNHLGVPRSASVFENSWMKLREVALTYQLPRSLVGKTKIFQNLSLSLIGRDLFYIFTTIPKGLNPEGVNGIGNMQGIEYSSMPRIRSFGFTVRASL